MTDASSPKMAVKTQPESSTQMQKLEKSKMVKLPPTGTEPIYLSLHKAIQPHINGPESALPEELRGTVKEAFHPYSWDNLTAMKRNSVAQQHDVQRDPAMGKENQYWFDLECEIDKVEKEIAEWESMRHQGVPSEAILKEQKLEALRADLANLQKRRELPPFFDTEPAPAEITDSKQPIAAADENSKRRHKWDEFALRRLLSESQEPGMSLEKLGENYGMSRQGITKRMNKAKELFGPKKASVFGPLSIKQHKI